jgi:hypothetical protein
MMSAVHHQMHPTAWVHPRKIKHDSSLDHGLCPAVLQTIQADAALESAVHSIFEFVRRTAEPAGAGRWRGTNDYDNQPHWDPLGAAFASFA